MFSSSLNIKNHKCITKKTQDEFNCSGCNKVFKSQKTFDNHKCLFCKVCEKIFSSQNNYKCHKCLKINVNNSKSFEESSTTDALLKHSDTLDDDDDDILSVSSIGNVNPNSFHPVDFSWQLNKCFLFSGFNIQSPSYYLFQGQIENLNNTKPKDIKSIIGDGNCFLGAFLM